MPQCASDTAMSANVILKCCSAHLWAHAAQEDVELLRRRRARREVLQREQNAALSQLRRVEVLRHLVHVGQVLHLQQGAMQGEVYGRRRGRDETIAWPCQ